MNRNELDEKHKSAIVSATRALKKYLEDLRRLASEGEAPESTGFAGKPMPLPKNKLEELNKKLEEIEQIVNEIENQVGKDIINERPDLVLTYMWASVILGRMEGVLRTIEPSNLEKSRGALPVNMKNFLEDRVRILEDHVKKLRKEYTTVNF
ncbi:MAG: hypothetical protein QXS21_01585 [Thermoproteota archaeon]|nr:hypothetical protein [Candidatus Brockarchaeota archaeon]MBO3802140.1 hypothetical protein [Candidatus Brockarchaeota archaeon]